MPRIGNVEVPDQVVDALARSAAPDAGARPGFGSLLADAAQQTAAQLRYGIPLQIGTITDVASAQDKQDYTQALQAAQANAGPGPASVDDVLSGRVGVGRAIGENLVYSLPFMAGSLLGGAAGAVAGGPVGAAAGAIAGGTPQFSGSNVARAVQETGELTPEAATRAALVAPVQSAADTVIARFLPGMGKVLGDMAATQAGGFLRRTATAMGKAAGTEAVTEAAQQVGERYAAGIPVADADAAGEYVNAAAVGFALGGVLGAGGGFRRSNAVAKPAHEVTDEDMIGAIDGILDGSAQRLALPAPADYIAAPGGDISINPSGTQQLLLPPPERYATPDVYVDSTGRAAMAPPEGIDPVALANLPRPSAPSDQELLARITQALQPEPFGAPNVLAQPQVPTATPDTSAAALAGLPVGETPTIELPPPARPFQDVDAADLAKARKAKNADPAIVAAIDEELAARKAEDPFSGVPMNQDIAKLRGATHEERVAGVTKLLEDGDSRAGTFRLAENLGIDVNAPAQAEPAQEVQVQPVRNLGGGAEPAPVAPVTQENAGVTAEPTVAPASSPAPIVSPQAAPDPAFAAQWAQIKRDAGITRMRSGQDVLGETPISLPQAQSRVMSALANVDAFGAPVDQVEKVARKMGLVTDDDAMDVTPLGRQAFLGSPEGLQETVTAAQQQGYTGKQASVFERGVRAALGAPEEAAFSDFTDMAAYQAGKVWAQDFTQNGDVRTAAQTAKIVERQAARTTGTAVDRRDAGTRLTPAQIEQQSLNSLLDMADLRTVGDSDVAELRRMVRDGTTTQELGAALQRVQGGQTLFRQPASQPASFTPATVARGQPIFKEMYDPAERTPQKAQLRAETEAATQAYDLRNLIEFAKAEGGITEVRAAKLHDLLDAGKTEQVRNVLKAFDPDTQPAPARKRLPTPPETVFDTRESYLGGADAAFEAAIDGKDLNGVLDHMIEAAPSRYHREIMRRVKALAGQLAKAGVAIDVKIARPGDTVPARLNRPDVRATMISQTNPPSATVWLKSSAMSAKGTNYQLAAHELLHAVTAQLVDFGSRPANEGTQLRKDVKDLIDLGNAVISHFNQRAADGNLSEFELAYYRRQTNALANADEILAWGLTNPDMQRYLQSIEYKPRQSVFGRMVELLRKLLGLDGKYDTALTELLRVAERITKPGQADLHSAYARNNPEGFDTEVLQSDAREGAAANRTAQAANDATRRFAQVAGEMVDRLNPRDFSAKFRRTGLGWLSHNQIDRAYGAQIPAAIEHSDAHRERVAIRSRFEQLGEAAYQSFEVLERANRNAAKWVGELMAATTEFQLDPDKTWDAHTHLGLFTVAEDGSVEVAKGKEQEFAQMKRLHGEVTELASKLKRGDAAGWKVFEQFRALNEAQNYARMAVGLHGLVATDLELSLGIENSWANPADQFMRAENVGGAAAIRDWWAKALDAQVEAATAFVREKRGEAAQGSASDQSAMRQHLSPIEMQIGAIHEAKAAMAKAPYFHLGRFGENFGSAVIAKGEDGRVDPVKQRKVAEALEAAGFGDAQISADSTKPRFMLRFDTVDQAVQFRELMLSLQSRGLLDADSEIKVGPRNRADNFGTAEGLPAFVASYIQSLEASPMFAEEPGMSDADKAALRKLKEDTIQLARDTWIESQPDSSISKVMAKRYTVPGYSKDMIRNFAHRWRVGSINIANVASAPKFNRAFTNMKAQYNDAVVANRRGADGELLTPADPFVVQDVMAELKARDARSPIDDTTDTFDKLRGYAHSYFLGFSPAYGLINMTQLGVVALPELAKKHGYAKSFHAMRRASTQALAVVKAVGAEAGKLGWKHWGDVAITDTVLRQAGLDASTRGFITHMLATGTIDIGSMARSLGQVADNKGVGGATETYLKLSSAIGLYTETFSRLVTALAARELHGGYGAEAQAYATKTVSEAMFDYQNWNTARQLGKKGFLGPVTPLLTQFMSYSVQITEKLYSEAMDAFSRARPGESAEAAKARKAEARRFLVGHLAAVTTLAGTLGMPFATVFATVIERLVDAFDDDEEPFDATAAYRNFLASVLGKGAAEVVARGLPRAAGFDISQRAGEQNLLPFSEFFADRRSWKDAVTNSAGRSLGAVPSMLMNVLDGGEQIASGDVIGGMKAVLPTAFKSPIEAYRMTADGYVDTKGNRLPMTPGAGAVLWQLMGFAPAEKAEYSEARGDQAARRGEIARKAGKLRQQITQAITDGDQDAARSLIQDALAFDADNPAFAVIPSLTATLSRQQQARAQSAATGAPLGVSMRDIAGQQMTGYANIAYGQ